MVLITPKRKPYQHNQMIAVGLHKTDPKRVLSGYLREKLHTNMKDLQKSLGD